MPVFKPDMSKPQGVDDSTTQAANAAQFVAEDGAELDEELEVSSVAQDQPATQEQPLEDAAEDEVSGNCSPLQTREAYLKKGEDLIRSLL
jgi:hypothetical protein